MSQLQKIEEQLQAQPVQQENTKLLSDDDRDKIEKQLTDALEADVNKYKNAFSDTLKEVMGGVE